MCLFAEKTVFKFTKGERHFVTLEQYGIVWKTETLNVSPELKHERPHFQIICANFFRATSCKSQTAGSRGLPNAPNEGMPCEIV